MRDALAWIAAALELLSIVPYIADIFRHRTKPNIVSWITWTILQVVAAVAAFSAHEPHTGLLLTSMTLCTFSVVVLGLKFGIAKLGWFDVACWIGTAIGLVLWWLFDSPLVAIIAAVVIDLVGVLPTVRHAWAKPHEETWQAFAIGVVASVIALGSLSAWTLAGALYPVYLVFANGIIAATILYQRKVRAH